MTIQIKVGLKGGPGSGNHGHGGRPGKEGGSTPTGRHVPEGAGNVAGATPNVKFQPTLPAGVKLPPHTPGDSSGLADYKAWYSAQVQAGQTPNLQQAIQMRQALAARAKTAEADLAKANQAAAEAQANSPEGKAAAEAAQAEADKKKAEQAALAKKVADAKKKKGKGGGAAKKKAEPKPKAEAKPKGGGAEKKPAKAKTPKWQQGLTQPPVMSGTTIPEAKYEERGVETYKTWLKDNSAAVAKMTPEDKSQVYDYFTKRSQNLAKYAKDPWAQVYVPDPPFSFANAGLELPDPAIVKAVLDPKAQTPAAGEQLYNYLQGKTPKEVTAFKQWYDEYQNAIHQLAIIPRTKPAAGTKERIIIHLGFKGSSTSGNYGHAGRPGKLGGSVVKAKVDLTGGIEADKAIKYYAGGGYRTINDNLRKSKGNLQSITTETGLQSAAKLDELMNDAVLTEPVQVTRLYYGGAVSLFKDTKPGDTFTDYGFTSTTTKDYKPWNAEDVGFVIQLKPGDRALSISTVAKRHKSEQELLLPRGTQFTIISREDTGKGIIFHVSANEPKAATKQFHLGLKGSATSGNYGHAGRPGKLGGSVPKAAVATGVSTTVVNPTQVEGYIQDVKQWDDKWRRGVALAALDMADIHSAIAVKDGDELVAVAKFNTQAHGEYTYLADLATKRPGYGRQTMLQLAQIAASNDLGLYWDSALDAIQFYQHLGFKKSTSSTRFYASLDELKVFINDNRQH